MGRYDRLWAWWKSGAVFCLTGWLIFVGGFGASTELSVEAIVCGVILAVFTPISVGCTAFAIAKNSRTLAILGFIIGSITLFTLGVLVNIAMQMSIYWLDIYTLGATPTASVGALVVAVTLIPLIAAPFYRLSLGYNRRPLYFIHGIGSVSCWLIFTSCVGLWIAYTPQVGFVYVGNVMATSMAALSLAVIGITLLSNTFEPPSSFATLPIVLNLSTYVQLGTTSVQALVQVQSCRNGSCVFSISIPALVFAGSFGFFIITIAAGCYQLGNCEVWLEPEPYEMEDYTDDDETESMDNNSQTDSSSDDDESEFSDGSDRGWKSKMILKRNRESKPLDFNDMVLSWPAIQQLMKVSLVLLLCFTGVMNVSFGAARPDKDFTVDSIGVLILGIIGVITPLLIIWWITKGFKGVMIAIQICLLLILSLSGYSVVYAAEKYTPIYGPGILAGAVGCAITAALLLSISVSFIQPQQFGPKANEKASIVRNQLILSSMSGIGWLVFVIAFGINIQQSGVKNPYSLAASILFISTTPCILIMIYVDALKNVIAVRIAAFIVLSISTSSIGVIAHLTGAMITKRTSSILTWGVGSIAGMFSGALITLLCYLIAIMHRTAKYGEVALSVAQCERYLTKIKTPGHRENVLGWLHTPAGKTPSIITKLSIVLTAIGWTTLIFGYGFSDITDVELPATVVHTNIVSMGVYIVSLSLYIGLQWVVFGILAGLGCMLAIPTSGAVIYSVFATRTFTPFAADIPPAMSANVAAANGACIAVIGLLAGVTTVLHRHHPPISTDTLMTIVFMLIICLLTAGWILVVVGIGLRRGSIVPGWMLLSFPGAFTVLFLVIEKIRPGKPFHWTSRIINVFLTAITMTTAGALLSEGGWKIVNFSTSAEVFYKLDFTGAFLMLISCVGYLVIVFIHAVRPVIEAYSRDSLAPSENRSDVSITISDGKRRLSDVSRSTVLESRSQDLASQSNLGSDTDISNSNLTLHTTSSGVGDSRDILESSQADISHSIVTINDSIADSRELSSSALSETPASSHEALTRSSIDTVATSESSLTSGTLSSVSSLQDPKPSLLKKVSARQLGELRGETPRLQPFPKTPATSVIPLNHQASHSSLDLSKGSLDTVGSTSSGDENQVKSYFVPLKGGSDEEANLKTRKLKARELVSLDSVQSVESMSSKAMLNTSSKSTPKMSTTTASNGSKAATNAKNDVVANVVEDSIEELSV
jgi:hypothetical protein